MLIPVQASIRFPSGSVGIEGCGVNSSQINTITVELGPHASKVC